VVLHEVVHNDTGKAIDYIILDVNPRFEKVLGITKEQAVGQKASVLYGTGQAPYLDMYAKVADTGESTSFEVFFEPMQKHFHIAVFSPTKGQFATVFQDITKHKETEANLRENEERFHFAMEAANDGLWDWNIRDDKLYFSPRYYTMLGYEPYEMPATFDTWQNLLHPDDVESSLQAIVQYQTGQRPDFAIEFRMRAKSGEWQWILSRGKIVERDEEGQPVRMVGTHVDITARKHAVDDLKKERDFNSLILESTDLIVIALNSKGEIIRFNNACEQTTGYRLEEVEGKCFWDFLIPPEQVEGVKTVFRELAFDQMPNQYENHWLTKDGERRLLSFSNTILKDKSGQIEFIISTAMDVTELRQAERGLRLFRQAIDSASDAVRILDLDGSSLYHNQAYVDLLGYTAEEVNNSETTISLYNKPDEGKQVAEAVAKGEAWNGEFEIRAKDGRVFPAYVRGDTIRDDEGNPLAIVVFGTDITERKQDEIERERLQQEIIKAQQRAIQELSTPIIPVMDRIIVLPLVGSIDSMRASDIMRTLLAGISKHHAKVVILDITGVAIVDTGVAAYLDKVVQAARLKGARTIITGISDAVAETVVDLGIDWSRVETLRDLQTGLVVALDSLGMKLSM
jgi:PAS domain S-box-containing protein